MSAGSVRGGISGAACSKERDDARARAMLINSQQVLQQPRLHAHLASDRSSRNTEVPFKDGQSIGHDFRRLHRHFPIFVFLQGLTAAFQVDVAGA